MNWISVKDKLPEDDRLVLCTYIFDNVKYERGVIKKKTEKCVGLAHFIPTKNYWVDDDYSEEFKLPITHWIEFPSPAEGD